MYGLYAYTFESNALASIINQMEQQIHSNYKEQNTQLQSYATVIFMSTHNHINREGWF